MTTPPLPRRLLAEAPAAVGAYIGAAYFFTNSISFANPAITIGRAFSDTFAGIAPASVPGFVVAQALGGCLALLAIRARNLDVSPADAATIVVPHQNRDRSDIAPLAGQPG